MIFLFHKKNFLPFATLHIPYGKRMIKCEIFLNLAYYAKFIRKHLCQSLYFNKKIGGLQLSWNPAQMFSCEFRKIFKSTFLAEHLLATTLNSITLLSLFFSKMCSKILSPYKLSLTAVSALSSQTDELNKRQAKFWRVS